MKCCFYSMAIIMIIHTYAIHTISFNFHPTQPSTENIVLDAKNNLTNFLTKSECYEFFWFDPACFQRFTKYIYI